MSVPCLVFKIKYFSRVSSCHQTCCLRWASGPWRGKISGVLSGLCCYSSTLFCLKLCRKAQHEVNLWGAEMWAVSCCHRRVRGSQGPSLWGLLYSFMFPARLNLTQGCGARDAGFLIANLKTDAQNIGFDSPKCHQQWATQAWHWGIQPPTDGWICSLYFYLQ